ncbi:hypothetical protein K443DRAFT_379119 [Laccaria amethystina LaAM-08-1]|uniref:Uncharacterized protein n=1 Tax=Laccaria amethystina LaAM-08-1 TaxID=1095629 RepID=A0A0C9XJ18_9AGAR|nr:hypothetical protein K443DRAFT_379119 [Laccaria amethystina LaAM-08-1]
MKAVDPLSPSRPEWTTVSVSSFHVMRECRDRKDLTEIPGASGEEKEVTEWLRMQGVERMGAIGSFS